MQTNCLVNQISDRWSCFIQKLGIIVKDNMQTSVKLYDFSYLEHYYYYYFPVETDMICYRPWSNSAVIARLYDLEDKFCW